ncbi:MAG TPA: imidazole glycerol phosphate synthase subunit HisH [Gemmatimonadaceae bacterium]|nr:imidazole glycerol phosphate synthase subunit HisH [Gemmatimonadaceae bacterium]
MRVSILDYGAGNLHSVAKALAGRRRDVRVEPDPWRALETDVLVLPGVGAFGVAAAHLAPAADAIRTALLDGLPCLGICLGMQLLFTHSDEATCGSHGIGLIPGTVRHLTGRRVPHMGWNTLERANDPLFHESGLATAYFAHSFVCAPEQDDVVRAWTTHDGVTFPAVVQRHATLGVQFHPEKSARAGVRFLRSFLDKVAS